MKIKNPETGEVIVIPQGMEDAVRDAIESGNDPMEAMQMKYGGIHINPANKGKFNATKKATGKTTEELTHSKNPLTRKRAIFAQNASRWKHQDGGQAMQQQQPQGGGQQDQMQQLVQMAEQALAQGASPEEVAQMLVQQGVPEQVVQQVIQYAIQDLQQQQQAQGQNPEEQMQQQNPQEEQAEMGYGGMGMYGNGGGINNPGFRALPAYVQQDIINNMSRGGKFLRKAQFGTYDDDPNESNYGYSERVIPEGPEEQEIQMNTMPMQSISTQFQSQPSIKMLDPSYTPQPQSSSQSMQGYDPGTSSGIANNDWKAYDPNASKFNWNSSPNQFSNKPLAGVTGFVGKPTVGSPSQPSLNPNVSSSTLSSSGRPFDIGLKDNSFNNRYNSQNILSGQSNLLGTQQATTPSGNTKLSSFDKYNKGLANVVGSNSYFGRGIQHLGQATFDFTKGGLEMAGANISNRNALGDEANNLRSAMRNDYKKVGKRPTDGNAIISKYGGKMMQDGGATYADKMKVSKNNPKADFIAEKGEYIVNNGIASKLETGGSHASGNDTAISLDKSSNPSYVLSDTPRLKQLQFGGKRVSPSKYAEMATVEALGKTPDQILKAYTAFTKRAGTEGKVFGDRISDATNQLLAQKYQKDLATVKQIADEAYHKQEQLKHAMGMDNDLDHAQEVNGMSMAKFGGMQDGVHMNYFNAPAVQYGGGPQLFSSPSRLGYNTTQMAYGGLPKMQTAGNADNAEFKKPYITTFPNGIPYGMDSEAENEIIRKSSEVKGVPGMGGYRNFLENQFWEGGDMGVGNDGINVQDNNTQPSLMPTRSYKEQQKNPYSTRENPISLNSGTNNIDWGQSNWGKSIGTVGTSPNATASYNAGQSIYPESYLGQDNSQQNNSFNMVSPAQQNSNVQPYLGQSNSNVVQTNTVPQNVSYSQTPVNNSGGLTQADIDLWKTVKYGDVKNNPKLQELAKKVKESGLISQYWKDAGLSGTPGTAGEGFSDDEILSGFAGQNYDLSKFLTPSTTNTNSASTVPAPNKGVTSVAPASVVSANITAPTTNANTSTTTTTATPTGTKTTTAINNDKLGIYNKKAVNKYNIDYNEMNKAGNDLWTDANYKTQWIPKVDNAFAIPENQKILIDRLENYSGQDANDVKLALSKGKTFEEKVAIAKRLATDGKPGPYHSIINELINDLPKEPVKTPPAEVKKETPPVVKGDEPVVPKLTIDKEEEEPYYDFPAINAFIPQPYGRNPIGLAQAQPQTIRPAKLNIQPELNEYNRGMRGAFRGTQGNTSVDVAQQMQGLNNLYGAQNKLYGQKYNFDEQSRMGAEQFNAQAIMNTDAGNLQRIGVQQDLINRREGALDTQRRKDFEKGIQNADKQNAYGLSKEYIESTFGPYLNNQGKLNFTYDPRTGEKINKDKEKTYTRAEYDKMIAAEKNAALPKRYGGSLKKIKLKLRK